MISTAKGKEASSCPTKAAEEQSINKVGRHCSEKACGRKWLKR